MKVAIIGTGAAGLATLRYGVEEGYECDAYEQNGEVGGLWVYHEDKVDKNGIAASSPMYKDLRVNIPKETMTFLDFPYPEMRKSYIGHPEVLDYFHRFIDHFKLERYIKLYSRVTQIKLIANEKWMVTNQNVVTKKEESKTYDAVFITNGHFSAENYPKIPGQEVFKGVQFHSTYFRKSDEYKDKRVLIIGGGSSAVDIARVISVVNPNVYLSHHGKYYSEPVPRITKRPGISHLTECGAVFVDNSKEDIDVVIYCTGYYYDIPFLTDSCGIEVNDNWVKPLYKHIVNIEHPTMYFIGIPHGLCVVPMFDIQARFAFAALKQHFRLPIKEEMIKELDQHMELLQKNGAPVSHAHLLIGPDKQVAYFDELATTAGIRPSPPVISKIYQWTVSNTNRKCRFKIIDDDNFTVHSLV